MKGRVLSIAGSDSSGGAGIQADIKTVTVLGGYAASAITAVTAQNTVTVKSIYPMPAGSVVEQIRMVMNDIGVDAIKVGMLATRETAMAVADVLETAKKNNIPSVVDPVLLSTTGSELSDNDVADIIDLHILPNTTLFTPNTYELSVFSSMPVARSVKDMMIAGRHVQNNGKIPALLLKGGHLSGDNMMDILLYDGKVKEFPHPRIKTDSTHGSGCTLASACATGLAQGLSIENAVDRAVGYVYRAILSAPGYGNGYGPLNHNCLIEKYS